MPGYTHYVINNLKQFYGNSTSDVVCKMLVDWTNDHKDLIERHLDSFEEWKEKQASKMKTDEYNKIVDENKKLAKENEESINKFKAEQFDKWMERQMSSKDDN